MRASRLLSILLMLQARGRMTAQALADEFEVSIRTVYRDIDQLSAAGVPVWAERGAAGGYRLLDGWRTRLTGLTPLEAEALLLSGLPGPAAQLGLGEAMADARLKLLAALPHGEAASESAPESAPGRIAERLHLDPAPWYRGDGEAPGSAEILRGLAEAVWNVRRVRVAYESWKGLVERDLAPLGLTLKAGVWYLVAEAGGGRRPRTYRVSAIRSAAPTGEAFARPRGFDLARYWTAWAKDFEARLFKDEATLRISALGLRRLAAVAPTVAAAAERTAGAPEPDGRRRVTIPIESVGHAALQVLGLGGEAEAVAPPELRARVGEFAARLSGLHA